MPQSTTDRNLLFGILALQMDFIRRDALIVAMNAWVLEKAKPLGRILLEQKALTADTHALLEALVQKHLALHGNDAEKSLAAVSSVGSVRNELARIADPDVQASLVFLPAPFRSGAAGVGSVAADEYATVAGPSVGKLTSAGLRFRILRPHAKGGLGEVHVAHDGELNREVALKEIQNKHADHPESRARFLLEAEITGGLEHPGIVPVYGLGQYADGRPFYAMRFIRGDSLQDAIKRYHQGEPRTSAAGERVVEMRKLLGRFIDVCHAIQYAHDRGILHRDLKPGNIMLGKYGETLVVDWGLAKSRGDQGASVAGDNTAVTAIDEPALRPVSITGSAETVAGTAVGTPQYMSPEQAAGRLDQLGPASDVYSLGATLYCVLTGKPSVADKDLGAILDKVQQGDFPRPRQVKPGVDPAMEAICLKAMALQPADRYASPREFADDIEHYLADEPVTAWREPWTVKTRRWVGQHRTFVTGASIALLVTLAAVIWGRWLSREHDYEIQLAARREEALQALVRSQQYHESLNQARFNNVHRPAGWVGKSLDALKKAALCDTPSRNLLDLRQEAAVALCGIDITEKARFAKNSASSWVAFSPDGRYLAIAPHQPPGIILPLTIQIIDVAKEASAFAVSYSPDLFGGVDYPSALAFSPDSRHLYVGTRRGNIHAWQFAKSASPLASWRASKGSIHSLSFHPRDHSLVSCGANSVQRWSKPKAEMARVDLLHETTGLFYGPLQNAWFVSQGNQLVKLDVDSLAKIDTKGERGPISVLNVVGGGGGFLAGRDGTDIQIWDLRSPQDDPARIFLERGRSAHHEFVDSLALSPQNDLLASTSSNRGDRSLKIWDTSGGRLLFDFFLGGDLNSLRATFSPDGNSLAVTADEHVRLYAIQRGALRQVAHQPALHHFVGLDDGSVFRLTSGRQRAHGKSSPGEIAHWVDGKCQLRKSIPYAHPANSDHRIAVSPKKDIVLFSWNAHKLGIWDLSEAPLRDIPMPGIQRLRFSSDGQRLWIVQNPQGKTPLVSSWDFPGLTKKTAWENHDFLFRNLSGLCDVAIGDQWILSGCEDGMARLLRASDGQWAGSLVGPHAGVRSVALFPGEQRALLGTQDGQLRVVSVPKGESQFDLQAHNAFITAIAFFPDGSLVATASKDGQVKFWKPNQQRLDLFLSLPVPGPVEDLQIVKVGASIRVLFNIKDDMAIHVLDWNQLSDQVERMGN